MNIIQEVLIIRRLITIVLVVGPIGLMINYLIIPESSTTTPIMSSFGEILIFDPKQSSLFFDEGILYQDDSLAFQISKPNDMWKIHTASDDFLAEELVFLKSKEYVDGIYLEKQHNKRFLITIFDMQTKDFQLKDFIKNRILLNNIKSDVKIPIKQISQSNDWAIFSMGMGENVKNRSGEQMLFLKDNRLYMLQYSGDASDDLTDVEKSDLRLILDSFEVLS